MERLMTDGACQEIHQWLDRRPRLKRRLEVRLNCPSVCPSTIAVHIWSASQHIGRLGLRSLLHFPQASELSSHRSIPWPFYVSYFSSRTLSAITVRTMAAFHLTMRWPEDANPAAGSARSPINTRRPYLDNGIIVVQASKANLPPTSVALDDPGSSCSD